MSAATREIVLEKGASRAFLGEACAALAPFVASFCRGAEREIRAEKAELEVWIRMRQQRGWPTAAEEEDLRACRKSLTKIRRVARAPLPQARRQIRCLARLAEGGEFRAFVFSEDSVTARVEPVRLGPEDRVVPPFDICFVPRNRAFFPIMIRRRGGPNGFLRSAIHPNCRADGGLALETEMEEVDVHGMFLLAFSWAMENL